MRLQTLLSITACLIVSTAAVDIITSSDEEVLDLPAEDTRFVAVASFPESNLFGHIVNGESNKMNLQIENFSKENVTLLSIAGGFYNPGSESLIKQTNNLTYGFFIPDGLKFTLPYQFHSELRTGEVKLRVELEYLSNGEKHRVSVFDSIVTVVEPEMSIFDLKMLSTYIMVLGILSGIGYFTYITFAPQPKKIRKPVVSNPEVVSSSGTGAYQEEWIPIHHLKKNKKGNVVSSGDEVSGGETSGTEGRRRKGKK